MRLRCHPDGGHTEWIGDVVTDRSNRIRTASTPDLRSSDLHRLDLLRVRIELNDLRRPSVYDEVRSALLTSASSRPIRQNDHCLRVVHRCAHGACRFASSRQAAAGVPLERIADVLGHDGTRMTIAYRHAVSPTIDDAAIMGDVLRSKS